MAYGKLQSRSPRGTEADAVGHEDGRVDVALRRAAVVGSVVPAAAAQ